jgi:hypothetical protein
MVYFDLALQTLLLHDAAEKASMNHSCPFQAVAKSFWRTKQNPDVLNQSSKSAKAHKKNVQSVEAVGDLSNYLILNDLRKSTSGGDAQDMLSPIFDSIRSNSIDQDVKTILFSIDLQNIEGEIKRQKLFADFKTSFPTPTELAKLAEKKKGSEDINPGDVSFDQVLWHILHFDLNACDAVLFNVLVTALFSQISPTSISKLSSCRSFVTVCETFLVHCLDGAYRELLKANVEFKRNCKGKILQCVPAENRCELSKFLPDYALLPTAQQLDKIMKEGGRPFCHILQSILTAVAHRGEIEGSFGLGLANPVEEKQRVDLIIKHRELTRRTVMLASLLTSRFSYAGDKLFANFQNALASLSRMPKVLSNVFCKTGMITSYLKTRKEKKKAAAAAKEFIRFRLKFSKWLYCMAWDNYAQKLWLKAYMEAGVGVSDKNLISIVSTLQETSISIDKAVKLHELKEGPPVPVDNEGRVRWAAALPVWEWLKAGTVNLGESFRRVGPHPFQGIVLSSIPTYNVYIIYIYIYIYNIYIKYIYIYVQFIFNYLKF